MEQLTLADLEARMRRLEKLAKGFTRELHLATKALAPMLHLERKAYCDGIAEALSGCERARVALALLKARNVVAEMELENRRKAAMGEGTTN